MWKIAKEFTVRIGGVRLTNCPILIQVNGYSPFSVTRREPDGLIGISFDIFDTEGRRIARVSNGKVRVVDHAKQQVPHPIAAYEVTDTDNKFSVVEKQTGRVVCSVCRTERDAEISVQFDLFLPQAQLHLVAEGDRLTISSPDLGAVDMERNDVVNCSVGISVNTPATTTPSLTFLNARPPSDAVTRAIAEVVKSKLSGLSAARQESEEHK